MEGNGAAPEDKEKQLSADPEAVFGDHELDDAKATFINGGKQGLDGAVVEVCSAGDVSLKSFTGLGKEELKKYAEDPFWVRLRWILFILFWVGWLAMLVAAIVIIVLAPRCPSRPDLKWYHTESAYNVYTKSFKDAARDQDGKQDGYGDLAGVIEKQEYIAGLGANTIWLSSIFKTDGTDGGIIDHTQLDEKFGTVDDFRGFLKKLMKKGVRVIIDLIPNQTSKNHTWFQKSRMNESNYGDYYIWTKQSNSWRMADGTSMWTMDTARNMYYLNQGSPDHPDLNLRNEAVLEEFKNIMNYWAGVGVSGFNIMGVEYLTENASFAPNDNENSQTRHFADNMDVIDYLRRAVDAMDNKPGREKVLIATVPNTDPEILKRYYGQEEKRGVHIVSVVLHHLDRDMTAAEIKDMLDPLSNISAQHWLGLRLSSPSVSRIATRMSRSSVTIAHALQALLPGTAYSYYGDEIGMKDGIIHGDNKYRTPMQWSKEANAGFSEATPWVDVNADYENVNVESLTAQLGSDTMMGSFKALMKLKKKESIQFGKTMVCTTGELLLINRRAEGFPSYLAIINLGAETAHKFMGEECAGGKETANVAFHSDNSNHISVTLDLSQAVAVKAGEVVVLEFAP